jgi:hypothetical protein
VIFLANDSIWAEFEQLVQYNKDIREMKKVNTTLQFPDQLYNIMQEKWVKYKKATGVKVSFNTFLLLHFMTMHHMDIGDSKAVPFEFKNKKKVSLERFDNHFKDL